MSINIIGAGLAGVEAACAIARFNIDVNLFEMKPLEYSEVHKNPYLAEVVCSNSFGSLKETTASYLLKKEMMMLNSVILRNAYKSKIPGGSALVIDRNFFAKLITNEIENNKCIHLIRKRIDYLDDGDIWLVACGPLCHSKLVDFLKHIIGEDMLYFYDAIAPIVYGDSINYAKGFWASRYSDDKDYFNCVLSQKEYDNFYNVLVSAESVEPRYFEKRFFDACMPVEEIAKKGYKTLLFGPMKPVGLKHGEQRPYAVVQLRKENVDGTLLSLVGFQTKLIYQEQKRVFGLIPALSDVEFAKFGSMHKNIYINSPKLLNRFLQLNKKGNVFFAGQVTGVEGYMASAATGIYAGLNVVAMVKNRNIIALPNETMIGSLIHYITTKEGLFQPMSENFGILPNIEERNKVNKRFMLCKRAIVALREWRKMYESRVT